MKRKKMLCRALLMVMALLMMMTWTAAALAEGETAGNVQDAQAADNTQLFWQYLLKTAKPAAPGRRKAPPSVSTTLDEDAQAVYNALRPCILAVANGTESSTEFTLDAQSLGISALSEFKSTYTCAELGLADDSFTSENGQAGANAIGAIINNISGSVHKVVAKAVDALQLDMPYEFYWFDKTKTGGWGSAMPYTISYFSDGTQTHIDHFSIGDVGVTVSMAVSADYSLSGGTGTYQTDSARIQAAQQAALTAGEIVAANASLPDDEKLKAYKTAICGMVDYNHAAAGNDATLYGDPWQLIWVFDGDESTKVVCEGYSKAFQFLCDLTQFDGAVYCYCVTGDLFANDEEDGEPHMWNIVTLDGKNYLADITNCDHESGEEDDRLFLVTPTGGSPAEGYVFQLTEQYSLTYAYADTLTLYSEQDLTLTDTPYQTHTMQMGADHVLIRVDGQEPTCTESGFAASYRCEACDTLFANWSGTKPLSAATAIPALGHDWNSEGVCTRCELVCDHQGAEPVRTLTGTTYREKDGAVHEKVSSWHVVMEACPICGYSIDRTEETTEQEAHSWTIQVGRAATCEETGEQYEQCEQCKVQSAATTIPALGHDWNSEGVCTRCELVCDHQGAETQSTPVGEPIYRKKDDEYHEKVSFWRVTMDACPICGYSAVYNEEQITEERHDFTDRQCPCGVYKQPDKPTGVKVTMSGKKPTLTWKAVDCAVFYNVYGGQAGAALQLLEEGLTNPKYTAPEQAYGKKYTYYVVAVNGDKTSENSAAVQAIALNKTAGLQAISSTAGAKLSWKAVTGADGYQILRDGKAIKTITSGKTLSFTDKSAPKAGKKCVYSIRATSKVTYSSVTVKRAFIRMGAVTGVTLRNTAGKLTVTWKKAAGAKAYEVYCTLSTVKPVLSTKPTKTVSALKMTKAKPTKGKTYRVYVRPVGYNGSTKTYGEWTAVKKITIKK